SGWLHAQADVTDAPKPTRAPTVITSERADFDLAKKHAVYRGNVHVDDPQMKLTCEELTADLPESGGHINHLVAVTNVVMDSVDDKGQTNHATSDKAIYDYSVVKGVTNETVTLTGNAKVKSADGSMTGEPITWDRVKNTMHAENEKMIIYQNATSAMVNTNAPAAKTNLRSGTIDLPTTKTNFPPGTIQNIERITTGTTTQ
ncbi:MAG TPA: LptA/OstA family protein, partial [Verrucomicrobiae bacterium]